MADFDKYAQKYTEIVEKSTAFSGLPVKFFAEVKREILEIILPTKTYCKGVKILSLGCGVGSLDSHLHEMGYEVHGIDTSVESLRIASKINPLCH